MRVGTMIEVISKGVRRRVRRFAQSLQRSRCPKWADLAYLIERETVKGVGVVAALPVETPVALQFPERLRERGREGIKRSIERHRGGQVLLSTLAVEKPEDLVFDQCSSGPSAILLSLKRLRGTSGQRSRPLFAAKKSECFCVEIIATGTRADKDLAGGSQFRWQVQRRTRDRELLNGAGGNVLGSGSCNFIRDTDPVDLVTHSSPGLALDGNSAESQLAGINRPSVFKLGARREL